MTTSYLDPDQPRQWSPPQVYVRSQAVRDEEWQNEGHTGITENFSGDMTPQEREDAMRGERIR